MYWMEKKTQLICRTGEGASEAAQSQVLAALWAAAGGQGSFRS